MSSYATPIDPLILLAPFSGQTMPLAEVPDAVFAGGMLGPGLGFVPNEGHLLAPCDGVITQLAGTAHALSLRTDQGLHLLMHIGLDTVDMNGHGFQARVCEGARVRAGELLIEFDLAAVAARARSTVSVLTLSDAPEVRISPLSQGFVQAGHSAVLALQSGIAREEPGAATSGATSTAAEGSLRRSLRLGTAGGLHARPAARAREAVRGFDARVELHFNGRSAALESVVALMTLDASEGELLELRGHGPQAAQALDAVAAVLGAADGDTTAATALPPSAAPQDPALASADGALLQGLCASPGWATGTLVHSKALVFVLPELSAQAQPDEQAGLSRALEQADRDLAEIAAQARKSQAFAEAEIFEVHRLLLEDPALHEAAYSLLAQGKTAGFAWHMAISNQIEALSRLQSARLKERAADLRDVEKRVLRALGHVPATQQALPPQAILTADEFTPSDLAELDRSKVCALLMSRGGSTSHAALIARQLGLPAVVALGDGLLTLPEGHEVVVDAGSGCVFTQPDTQDIARARNEGQRQGLRQARHRSAAHGPAQTLDGQTIEVAANIASLSDAHQAWEQGADAVGLLRTELLFMDREQPPDEEEQGDSYQAIVSALQGRPVIIRTLDAGADKPVKYLKVTPESNPALGLRGIRLAQRQPALLDQQLRGLLRVRSAGPLRILLPMVTELNELLHIRQRIDEIARSLQREDRIEVGVMIEVPSAAILADQLAQHADFLSIGSNDLTQYTLAMDRCQAELAARIDGMHPAVLRLIDMTVRGASQHGKWVGVCGALAAEPAAVPVLLGLGVRELSVPAPAIAEIKARVRSLDLQQCSEAARALLAMSSAQQVRIESQAIWPWPH